MEDRRQAASQIEDAARRFLAEIAQATDVQWRFRPSPMQWSMADVTEHVVISNRNIARRLAKGLLASPIERASVAVIDAEIPYLFYRGEEPPDVSRPTGTMTDRTAAAEALEASAKAILEWAGGVTQDLRAFGLPHPVFGVLDGIQWLLFAGAHVERHRAQLIGLKSHRELPSVGAGA